MSKTNLFIVGTAKAGTSYLYNLLNANDDVFMSKIKEPNFFYKDYDYSLIKSDFKQKFESNLNSVLNNKLKYSHDALVKSNNVYNKLFENYRGEYKYFGEASISYLHAESSCNNIKKYNPDSKIIICIRNPIERLLSHVNMDFNNGLISSNFKKEILDDYNSKIKGHYISNMYVELGMYSKSIKKYLNAFGKENVCIIQIDKLRNEEFKLIRTLNNFLQINLENSVGLKANVAKSPIFKIPKFVMDRRNQIKVLLNKTGAFDFFSNFFFKASKKIEFENNLKIILKELYYEDIKLTEKILEEYYND